jgi:hypothetical protein
MEYVIPGIIILFVLFVVFSSVSRRRKFAALSVVKPGVEYPNNHHVLGVGYYHAASQTWFPHPWNEYREDRGYYWNGTWNTTPDQRMVLKSPPHLSEVERVNQEWRKADPDRTRKFWETVEHEGFGTAIRRSEGS